MNLAWWVHYRRTTFKCPIWFSPSEHGRKFTLLKTILNAWKQWQLLQQALNSVQHGKSTPFKTKLLYCCAAQSLLCLVVALCLIVAWYLDSPIAWSQAQDTKGGGLCAGPATLPLKKTSCYRNGLVCYRVRRGLSIKYDIWSRPYLAC